MVEVIERLLPRRRACFRLPRDLDFPIYGLGPSFIGSRELGTWVQASSEGCSSDRARDPVFYVMLAHRNPVGPVIVAVHTVAKLSGAPYGPHGVTDAAGFALINALTIDDESMRQLRRNGPELVRVLDENLRLAEDLGLALWDRTSVLCDGVEREASFHRIDSAWACVLDVDERVAVAVSAYGLEPRECDLRRIADPDSYKHRGWLSRTPTGTPAILRRARLGPRPPSWQSLLAIHATVRQHNVSNRVERSPGQWHLVRLERRRRRTRSHFQGVTTPASASGGPAGGLLDCRHGRPETLDLAQERESPPRHAVTGRSRRFRVPRRAVQGNGTSRPSSATPMSSRSREAARRRRRAAGVQRQNLDG